MLCRECGHPNLPDARFCEKCSRPRRGFVGRTSRFFVGTLWRTGVAVFSTGWLFPAWLTGMSVLDADAPESLAKVSLLGGSYREMNAAWSKRLSEISHREINFDAFTYAMIWLAVVVFFWAWSLARRSK